MTIFNLLFVDIGNTSTDLLFISKDHFSFHKIKDFDSLSLREYLKSIFACQPCHKMFVSSVNKNAWANLQSIAKSLNPDLETHLIASQDMFAYCQKTGLKVDNLDILGSDLFCDIISKKNQNGQIIIDLGTASKILFLDAKNYFHGCQIFPSLLSFPKILNDSTDLLGENALLENPPLVSLKTQECISSGAIHGVSALITSMIKAIKKEFCCPNCDIYLTGGNAKFILKSLREFSDEPIIYDEYHILKGLVRLSGFDPDTISFNNGGTQYERKC